MKSPKCSVFQKATDKYPLGELNLIDLVTTFHFKDKIIEYRSLTDSSDKRLKKLDLPAYTPSGIFSIRRANSLLTPSNVICIDIDGKDNPSISNTDHLKRMICKLPYIWYCGDSVSGCGVFCLIKYENHLLHKLYFKKLCNEFGQLGIVIDKSCSDISRLRFVSYDPNPFVNTAAEVFSITNDDRYENNICIGMDSGISSRSSLINVKHENVEDALLTQSYFIKDSRIYNSNRCLVESIINKVILSGIDITIEYNDWFTIGCIIKMMYGESGRSIFHQVSRFYPNYYEAETDNLYDSIMSHTYLKRYDCILRIAQKYNVFP